MFVAVVIHPLKLVILTDRRCCKQRIAAAVFFGLAVFATYFFIGIRESKRQRNDSDRPPSERSADECDTKAPLLVRKLAWTGAWNDKGATVGL
jgi:hypothetical protein